jgi:formate dehydrogenase subunit gamma
MTEPNKKIVSEIAMQYGAKPEMLVQILQAIVMRCGWIAENTIRQLADELNLSRADVHGVVQYYHDFRTTPPGEHIVKICQAEACQAMGSSGLTEHARRSLTMEMGETENNITLEAVYCLGNCACAPAVMIDGKTYGRVSESRFSDLVASFAEKH